jgi:hypothetical protein
MTTTKSSDQLCMELSAESPHCLLAFSCGKDSVGAWIQTRRYFRDVVPFFCWLVPGLIFEENYIDYAEKHFGSSVRRYPHPSVGRLLANQVFSAPENRGEFDHIEPYTYQQLYAHIRDELALDGCLTAVGVRSADSIFRRSAIMKTGGVNRIKGEFYPCHDWNADRLESEIRNEGIKLPVDYVIWGRSFDGVDQRFMGPMRERLPEDFERVRRMYPLCVADIKRQKWRAKYAGR